MTFIDVQCAVLRYVYNSLLTKSGVHSTMEELIPVPVPVPASAPEPATTTTTAQNFVEQELESINSDLSHLEVSHVNCETSQSEIGEILKKQDARKVSAFEASKLDKDAKKNWDIFYKRNETRFFKDRHWTLREFEEILSKTIDMENLDTQIKNKETQSEAVETSETVLLEIGCGVGNFAFPILEAVKNLRVWACDFSPRAIDFVKENPEYREDKIRAFVCDIVTENCFASQELLLQEKVDFISMIFVLSAISPEKHCDAIQNLIYVSKPGTVVCFRDYGRYDMAQLRFKGGKKIQDNFYARRDGTRAYYFTPEEVKSLFTSTGQFKEIQCDWIHRRTINLKENVDVGRIFVQGKFIRN